MAEPQRRPPAPEPLRRPVTDAHTHLDPATAADEIAAARAVGVTRMVDVGCDVASSRAALAHATAHDVVIAAVAIHPNDAARLGDDLDEALRVVESMPATSDRIRAIGETGIDRYRTRDDAGLARQRTSFAAHIGFAKANNLALVIHDREAHADIIDILDGEGWPDRVQFHCFSGDAAFARLCLDRGAWLSFPGTITFKANHDLREALALTPSDRVLVETDAPYLTPVPHRGKPNAPYLLPHTVRFAAQVRGDDPDALCDALASNATAVFGAWGDDG